MSPTLWCLQPCSSGCLLPSYDPLFKCLLNIVTSPTLRKKQRVQTKLIIQKVYHFSNQSNFNKWIFMIIIMFKLFFISFHCLELPSLMTWMRELYWILLKLNQLLSIHGIWMQLWWQLYHCISVIHLNCFLGSFISVSNINVSILCPAKSNSEINLLKENYYLNEQYLLSLRHCFFDSA